MNTFESQVSRAAIRLRNKKNARLTLPPAPRRTRRLAWGWVATPAAAIVGLVIGIEIGQQPAPPVSLSLQDTLTEQCLPYVNQPIASNATAPDTQPKPRPKATFPPAGSPQRATSALKKMQDHRTGKCVLEDGVDYSMLYCGDL